MKFCLHSEKITNDSDVSLQIGFVLNMVKKERKRN